MRKALLASVAVLILGNIFAAAMSVEEAKRARGGVPIYDVGTLSKYLDQHVGELVAVMCTCRSKDIRQLKPNWYESSILQPDPQKKGKFTDLRVMIGKSDLDAFKSIPITPGRDSIILQGRVEHDPQGHSSLLHLIPRNTRADTAAHP